MILRIPPFSLTLLIGASGSGKSTFARSHFGPLETVSFDFCRALVSNDESHLAATQDAFDLLHLIVQKRLAAGLLTVVDATNVQPDARAPLLALARRHHCPTVALVLDIEPEICMRRTASRIERQAGLHVIQRQHGHLRRSTTALLNREGFQTVYILTTAEQVASAAVERHTALSHRSHLTGPFDIIGDVHGCADELETLLTNLGYIPGGDLVTTAALGGPVLTHPDGRIAIFVGDLVDRGPRILDTVRLVWSMVETGNALCVPGNHDDKLARALRGHRVTMTEDLKSSLADIHALDDVSRGSVSQAIATFIAGLSSYLVLDGGRLVVAHAGLPEVLQKSESRAARAFALYGPSTGEMDDNGVPRRIDWAKEYQGSATVIYGHTPVTAARRINNTMNIDTGCVFGGALTALRYPEQKIVSVPAQRRYAMAPRPFINPITSDQDVPLWHATPLDAADFLGQRAVTTSLLGQIIIPEHLMNAALATINRTATHPAWLIYVPPSLSPCDYTSDGPDLEHPNQAFQYYRRHALTDVICEEMHTGPHAIAICCRTPEEAHSRFGANEEALGIIYMPDAQRLFADATAENALLTRLHRALTEAGLWSTLQSEWIAIEMAIIPATTLAWPLSAHIATDVRLAPIYILASEGEVHTDKDHLWHMAQATLLSAADPHLVVATRWQVVHLGNEVSERAATAWWEGLTVTGGAGVVVKPLPFIVRGQRGVIQPALACRSRAFLHDMYRTDDGAPMDLSTLRTRDLSAVRSLTLREFALGIEALTRFVVRAPLPRVHECVLGILALRSDDSTR